MRACALLLCAIAALATASSARAEPPPQEAGDAQAEAVRLFNVGSELFLARRYGQALDALRASYDLVPSPNSGLLIARCLRALGHSIEAAQTYADVETEARRRAAADPTYLATANAAASEGAAVRSTLGALYVHVANAPLGTRVEVGGVPATLAADGDVVVWRFPGATTVRVRPPSGTEQTRTVALAAGKETRVDVELVAAPPVTSVPTTASDQPPAPAPAQAPDGAPPPATRWVMAAAIASGAIAIAGLAMFTGFAISTKSTYDSLERRCGPSNCGPADRGDADAGKRMQTIANISLGVGIAGAVAAGAFTYLMWTPSTASPSSQHASTSIVLGPGSLSVLRRFD
jgi:hypothetical protein